MSYEIHDTHHGMTTVETGARYISAFEGVCGDGWVFSVDRTTHEGYLSGNDIDPGKVVISPENPTGGLNLDRAEKVWLAACWMAVLHKPFDEILPMLD